MINWKIRKENSFIQTKKEISENTFFVLVNEMILSFRAIWERDSDSYTPQPTFPLNVMCPVIQLS